MEQQFSSCDQRIVVYAFDLRAIVLTLKFCLRKPKVLFDLAVVLIGGIHKVPV